MIRNGVKKTQPIKKALVIQSKPSLYIRVEKEKIKMKNLKKLTYQTEFSLKKKYFNKLKFYHKFIQMRKRNVLNYKYMAYSILKDFFIEKLQKYCEIIEYFDRGRKIKVFTLLFKEHILKTKKNFITRKFIINGFQRFIKNTTREICLKYMEYRNIEKLYFQIFLKQSLNESRNVLKLSINKLKYVQMNMKKEYKNFFELILNKKTLKLKEFAVNKYNIHKSFFTAIKRKINSNLDLNISIRKNQMKNGFKYFIDDCKRLIKQRKKNIIANMFYIENLKRKIYEKYKNMYIIKKNFCNIVYGVIKLYKRRIVEKIKREIQHISNLRKLYKQMKNIKKKQIYKKFFRRIKKTVKFKKIIYYARNHYYEKLIKKVFKGYENFLLKEKAFKVFLSKFKKIYILNLKKNYIDLMRYKVHKFLDSPSLPQIIYYYLNKDFEKKLITFKYKEIGSFFRKCKKQKLSKMILKKKMFISNAFQKKKLKLKCFLFLKDYIKFCTINKKYNQIILNSIFKVFQKLNKDNDKVNMIKSKVKSILYKDYLGKIILSYILKNNNKCLNNKNKTIEFLITQYKDEKLKKKINDIPILIITNLIIKIIKKRPFKRILIYLIKKKYILYLIKKYIYLLIEAKNEEKEVHEKYSMIKNEILNPIK